MDGQALPGAAHTRGAASAPSRSPTADGSRPETADAAGAVAAAEIVQLESLVTMGDGKHDYFTCHCWGLEGTLWAINEPGQLVRRGKREMNLYRYWVKRWCVRCTYPFSLRATEQSPFTVNAVKWCESPFSSCCARGLIKTQTQ